MSIEKEAIERYGKTIQTIVAIEEMSELTKELSKNLRGEDNHGAIVEEVADVYIMLHQLTIMYDIDINEIINVMNEKLERLKNRLEGDL